MREGSGAFFRHNPSLTGHRCIRGDARIEALNAPSSTDWEYAMVRSPITLTRLSYRLQRLSLWLRALYLHRPGLVAKVLAIVAFFSIGIV